MLESLTSYIDFMYTQIADLATPLRAWCFYEHFGLRVIMMLVSTGIIAFAVPNILDQSECKLERDSYIKSLFEKKHYWMKINSGAVIFLALITILTYLAIWNAVSGQDICKSAKPRIDNPERFSFVLIIANLLTISLAIVTLSQKIFCLKHKQ